MPFIRRPLRPSTGPARGRVAAVGLALVVAASVGACSADTPPAASGSTQTTGPAASPSGSLPDFRVDPALEALLPEQVDGRELAKISVGADDLIAAVGIDDEYGTQVVGGADARAAAAYIVGSSELRILAIPLAPTRTVADETLLATFVNLARGEVRDVPPVTVGGREVHDVSDAGRSKYVFLEDGVIFVVEGEDPGLVEEAIRSTPAPR